MDQPQVPSPFDGTWQPQASPGQLFGQYLAWGLPQCYVALVISTTGFRSDDLLLGVSHMYVEDGVVQERGAGYLNWDYPQYAATLYAWRERAALPREREDAVVQRMRTRGRDPLAVLRQYRDLLRGLLAWAPIVGHNVLAHGLPVLQRHIAHWLADWSIDLDELTIYDLGQFHKALEAGIGWDGRESIENFQRRVADARRPGVRWGLSPLLKRYDITIDKRDEFGDVQGVQALYERTQQFMRARYPRGLLSPQKATQSTAAPTASLFQNEEQGGSR